MDLFFLLWEYILNSLNKKKIKKTRAAAKITDNRK